MRKKISYLIFTSLLLSGFYLTSLAQQSITSATLSGRVVDTNGAAVHGASVSIINLDRNQSATTSSDSEGDFRFIYLPSGRYRLKASASGFAPADRELTLTLGEALDLQVRLAVTGFETKIDITAETPLIETVRTQIAETMLPLEINNLPLNGRNYLDLAALTPAVTRANPVGNQRFAETSAVPGTQISVQLNAHDVLVVRPVGGVWSHGLCPDVTAAVLTSSHWTRQSHGFGLKGYNYVTVWDLLMQAALQGRSVNLQVSDTVCHANGYPLIETVTIFP